MRDLLEGVPEDAAGVLRELWAEYRAGESPEARLVRAVDKLEMAVQALAYQEARDLDLAEFLQSARDSVGGGRDEDSAVAPARAVLDEVAARFAAARLRGAARGPGSGPR